MRRIAISVLSVFAILPTVASARLPVVNISSGGVSARSAFGEDASPAANRAPVVAKTSATTPTRTRSVATRVAKTVPVAPVSSRTPADMRIDIMASNDVLSPRRPSNDLWAKNDTGLRVPHPSEFSVIRSDDALPEESLITAPTRSTPVAVASASRSGGAAAPALSELDAQIARLTELQKRASDSVRTVSPRTISNPMAPIAPISDVATADMPGVALASADTTPVSSSDEGVSLRRLVVPMESDDVVVRTVEKNTSPRIVAVRDDMTKMTPSQLRNAFRKTFLSENKHLSTFSIDERFDVASDMSSSIEGFTSQRDLSETGGIRPLEIKIKFRNEDSALSRENYTLLTEYAGIVVSKPTRAIQVSIPQYMTQTKDARKLAARRLAIVEQVLTDNGVSQQRIVPVLSTRDEPGFVLRVISSDQYDTLTQQKRDIFGDAVSKKTYKSMSW